MNTEYTCVDEKVVVRDENGCNKVIPYQDNIEEVLISENTIEELEKKREEINKNIKNYIKRCNWPVLLKVLRNILPIIIGIAVPLLVGPALEYFGATEYVQLVAERIRNVVMCFTVLPSTAICIGNFLEDKYKNKEERALNTQMQMLNEGLNEEQEYLKKLKNDSKKTITRDYKTITINNNEIKENIDTYCDLYYDCSYNLEDYYKYYLKYNRLPKDIRKSYTKEGQEIVKEYLEEKGPVLIKSRRTK